MTLVPPTRKRNRSCAEEDFLPLSKKINNLHINNWGDFENPSSQLILWNNRTKQPLTSQHLHINEGRSEDSVCSSSFENTQESTFIYGINETGRKNIFSKGSCESTSAELNYNNNNNQEDRQSGWSMIYNPDLNMEENPYYYENNKLLFELYVERLRRGGY